MKTVTSGIGASLEDVPVREEFLHVRAVRWDRLGDSSRPLACGQADRGGH